MSLISYKKIIFLSNNKSNIKISKNIKSASKCEISYSSGKLKIVGYPSGNAKFENQADKHLVFDKKATLKFYEFLKKKIKD
jgi:hypothetical protein